MKLSEELNVMIHGKKMGVLNAAPEHNCLQCPIKCRSLMGTESYVVSNVISGFIFACFSTVECISKG